MNDDNFWKEALPQLRDAFKDLTFFDLNEDIIIGRSVTEYETLLAMAMAEGSSGGVDRLRWLYREVKNGHSEELDPWQFYSEYKDQSALTLCDFLCKKMTSVFGEANVICTSTNWPCTLLQSLRCYRSSALQRCLGWSR